jgi:uncharacterized membrane protein
MSEKSSTLCQRIADQVVARIGSCTFVTVQTVILILWIAYNSWTALRVHLLGWVEFDPYPFILLNLALSFQAAYTGPIILIAANRQAERDRLRAEQHFQLDVRHAAEIAEVLDQLKEVTSQLAEVKEFSRLTKERFEAVSSGVLPQ